MSSLIIAALFMLSFGPTPAANTHHVCRRHIEPPVRYPVLPRNAWIEATVTLSLEIAEDGTVSAVHTTGGHPLLQEAARKSVEKWRFQCLDCANNERFEHVVVFHYKLRDVRKEFENLEILIDAPGEITITADKREINY